MIGEDTGVEHFGSGEDELGHGTPDGTAFGDGGIAVVGSGGQLVLGQELVVELQQSLTLGLLSVLERENPKTMALAVDTDGLKHREKANKASSARGGVQDVTATVQLR